MTVMSSVNYNEGVGESYVSRDAVKRLYNATVPVASNFQKKIFLDDNGQIYVWVDEDGEKVKTPIFLSGVTYMMVCHLIKNECASIWELAQYSHGSKPDIMVRKCVCNANAKLVDYGCGIDSIGSGVYRIY
jgi:hypothetical protein